MSATVYQIGEKLYERARVARSGRLKSVILEWVVLSTVFDAEYLDDDRQPIQVVTLRAFVEDRASYQALMAWQLDIKLTGNSWSRERPKEQK